MKSLNNLNTSNTGYIALISTIIISVLLLTITTALSFSGFFVRFNVLGSEYKEKSNGLAEACGDAALLKLAIDPDPAHAANQTVQVGSDSCKILDVVQAGGKYTIYTQGNFQRSYTNLEILVNDIDLSIISWEEIPCIPVASPCPAP